MDTINTVISNNIKELRKAHGLTQAELAEKLNYSNKAVSRWESGEVIPDVITLNNICEIFQIPIAKIFEEDAVSVKPERSLKITIGNKLAITLISIIVVWFIATITYVCIEVTMNESVWQLFIYPVPLSCVVGIIFNSIWGRPMVKHILLTILIWSLLASIYLSLLEYNLWVIFIVGVPIQIVVILWANITSNNIKRKREEGV